MTIVVALVHKDVIWIGSDSTATAGGDKENLQNPKIFSKVDEGGTEWLIGFAGDYRAGQLLEHMPKLSAAPKGENGNNLIGFLTKTFTRQYMEFLRENYALGESKRGKAKSPVAIILGISGEIFVVDESFGVLHPKNSYAAIGSGSSYALGALGATAKTEMDPRERTITALELAQEYDKNVGDPFSIRNSEGVAEAVEYIRSRRRR